MRQQAPVFTELTVRGLILYSILPGISSYLRSRLKKSVGSRFELFYRCQFESRPLLTSSTSMYLYILTPSHSATDMYPVLFIDLIQPADFPASFSPGSSSGICTVGLPSQSYSYTRSLMRYYAEQVQVPACSISSSVPAFSSSARSPVHDQSHGGRVCSHCTSFASCAILPDRLHTAVWNSR